MTKLLNNSFTFPIFVRKPMMDDDPSGDPPANDPPANDPKVRKNEQDKIFSQADINRILADDRRKLQGQLQKSETMYQELLKNQALTANERASLEENLAEVQVQLRSKDEQAKLEKKQIEDKYKGQLEEAISKATSWEGKYKSETIVRSITDAAASEAYNPAQIVAILQPLAKYTEEKDAEGRMNGSVMIDFHDFDAEGKPTVITRTPKQAIERMMELKDLYGNLFRRTSAAGVGGSPADFKPGKIDYSNLTPEQYRKLRAENPELIGLK